MENKDLAAQMAEALAKEAGQDATDVATRMEAGEGSRQSALAKMMAEVQDSAVKANVVKAQTKVAKTRKPASPKVDDGTRDVVVIISDSANQAFLTTNKLYSNRTAADIVKIALRDLKNKTKITALLAAEDIRAYHSAVGLDVDLAETHKAAHHDELVASGVDVGSTKPKIEAAAASVAPAPVSEQTEEQDVVQPEAE